jgi:thioesterase domain-containing protein
VYGVQARGIDGVDRPAETIEEMALDYADRIERVNPAGSFVLAGHSLGGLLAWETARVLRSRGRHIALLALIDSRVPHRGWVEGDGVVRRLSPLRMMRRRVRRIGADAYYGARYASFALRGAAVSPELARIRQIRSSSRAFDAYRPTTLDEHVVFFAAGGAGRARPPVPGRRPSEDDWRELAGTIEVVEVPGTHTGDDSILAEPNVEVLAEELRVRIEVAAAQAEVVDSLPGPVSA